MQITLKQYSTYQKLPSIMSAKHELMVLKKKGHVFLKENLTSLEENEPFQLYYYLMAHSASKQNAFPIPKHRYLCHGRCSRSKQMMMNYFADYFTDSSEETPQWREFEWEEVYIGEEYVWITRKSPFNAESEALV